MMKKRLVMLVAMVVVGASLGMAGDFNASPTNWIPGYTSDGTNMVIPIASLQYLSAGQSNASTGDVRQIVFAIQETIYQKWNTIPETNRSGRINVTRSSNVYTNRISYTYTYRADLRPVSLVIMPE